MTSPGSGSDWVSGVATVSTMLGILTFALFPFALPALVLVVALGVALALPLVVLGAVAAALVGAWRGIGAAGRGISRSRGRRKSTGPATGPRPSRVRPSGDASPPWRSPAARG